MGEVRSFSRHVRWSEEEVAVIRMRYSIADKNELQKALPGRTLSQIQNKANGIGIVREKTPKRTADQVREAKRILMASRRAANPEEARAYQRNFHHNNRDRQTAKMRAYVARRFFWSRQMHLRGSGKATARELAALWKKQRGLCALTGRRMDRSAHLDHIVPMAKGGGDCIDNFRWVCNKANLAKRALSDTEFIALCSDVMRWIGQQIQLVDGL